MRTIHASILAELASKELRPFMLFHTNISSTDYRYTDCDVAITYSGTVYEARNFVVEAVKYSINNVVDFLTIEIDMLKDETLKAAFVGGTPQGAATELMLVVLDDNYDIIVEPVTLFEGEIDSWNLDEEKLKLTAANQFVRWAQRTLAKHSSSCRWKTFKGTECGYSGAATECDRTYNTCVTLENTANFGGFRWLPSIIDKEIWWGRVQAK